MNTDPIMEYKTQGKLDESLREWQKRLFLDNWTICASIS